MFCRPTKKHSHVDASKRRGVPRGVRGAFRWPKAPRNYLTEIMTLCPCLDCGDRVLKRSKAAHEVRALPSRTRERFGMSRSRFLLARAQRSFFISPIATIDCG